MIDSTNPRILADNIRALSGASGSQASDISKLQEAVEALGNYSTSEYDTGKTYDDKTVYGKVFKIDSMPNTTTVAIPHGITDFILTSIRGVLHPGGAIKGGDITRATNPNVRYDDTSIIITSNSDVSGCSGIVFMEYIKVPAPSALASPAPDDTRSIEPEVREAPEEEPIEAEPVVEVKKTTRRKTTTE